MKKKKILTIALLLVLFTSLASAKLWAVKTAKVPVGIDKVKGNAGECFKIVDSQITLSEKSDSPQAIVTIELVKKPSGIKNPQLRGIEIAFIGADKSKVNVLKYMGNDAEYQKINQAMKDGNLNQQFKLKFEDELYDCFYVENIKSLKKAYIARVDVVEALDNHEFSAFFRKFQKAYVKPDIHTLANLTNFPFGINHSTRNNYQPSETMNGYPNTKQGFIDGGYGEFLYVNPETGKIEFDIRDERLDIINPELLGTEQKISSDKNFYAFAVVDIYKHSTAADYILYLYIKKKKGKLSNPESADKTTFYFKKVKNEYKLVDVTIPG